MQHGLQRRVWMGLLALFIGLQLSGCSFQLRSAGGEFVNPQLQVISLQAEPDADGAIKRGIKDLLPKNIDLQTVKQAVPVAQPTAEQMAQEIFLVLLSTQKQEKRTAVSIIGETTAEFIRWVQPYQVMNIKGEVLFTDEAFAYRDRQMNPQGLMAANQEVYEMRQQMADEIALQIVRRIQYLSAPN